jgi:hypothetical protein
MADQTKAQKIEAALPHFTGTNQYYRYMGKLVLTDGVKFLAEEAGAFWLLDIIWSYQHKAVKDEMLQYMQFWNIKVDRAAQAAVVTCERDSDDVAYKQEVEFTDFPLAEARIWVELADDDGTMVVMLPSER